MDADLDRRLLRFRNLSKKEDAGALARDLLTFDRTRDAMEVAATGLHRKPDQVGLVIVLGRVLLEGGDLERAQEAFLQASRMDRSSSEALRYLGETLLRRGDNPRAAKVLGRAIAVGRPDPELAKLHERAIRLARGQAVRPDAELDPIPASSRPLLAADSEAPRPLADSSQTSSSWPPRTRKKTLMMGSDRPAGRESELAADEPVSSGPPPDEDKAPRIESSPSIKISDGPAITKAVRPRRSTTPHGVKSVKPTLMFDPTSSATPASSASMPEPAPADRVDETAGSIPPTAQAVDPVASEPVHLTTENVSAEDAEIEVERHTPVAKPPVERITNTRPVHEEVLEPPTRSLRWLWLLLLPIVVASGAFFAVRSIDRAPTAKSEDSLMRALLQPDRAELAALAKTSKSPRDQALAAAHLVFRNGLKREPSFEALLKQKLPSDNGESDAAQAVLALSKNEPSLAVDAARKASMAPNVSVFAKYLAGRTLASTGLPEGSKLLESALREAPHYRDAVLALAMDKSLGGAQASKVLREAPSDDVDAIIPLFRSAVENPTQPERQTATDRDLITNFGDGSRLLHTFLHEQPTKLQAALEKSDVRDPLLLGLLASVALAREAPGPALEAALRAKAMMPTHPGVRRLVAKSAFALDDPEAAWTALADFKQHDDESLIMLSQSAAQTINKKYIRDALKRIHERGPDKSVQLSALAIRLKAALVEDGEGHRDLLREARALSAQNPGNAEAIRAHVSAARSAGDTIEEGAALDELVRAAPQDAEAHLQYAAYWQSRDDFDKAEAGYSRALAADPHQAEAARRLGELLLTHGHFGKAENHYRATLADSIDGTIGRTRALAALGRNIDGLAALDQVVATKTLSSRQRIDLASAALALSRPDHAEALVKELANSKDADVESIVTFAKALSAQGKAEEATQQLDRALAIAPDSISALLAKAEAAVHAGKPSTAHKYLAEVYPKISDPKTPEPIVGHYWLMRGRAYLIEGGSKLEDAREALRGAVRYRGTLPEAYFFLGESLASVNSPEAAKAYADYVALAPNGQYLKRAERALGTRK